MFNLINMAFRTFLGYLLKSSIIKWVVFFAFYFIVADTIPLLRDLVVKFFVFQPVFDNLPDGVNYFLIFLRFDYGFNLVMSAYFTRFIIRRIPVIG